MAKQVLRLIAVVLLFAPRMARADNLPPDATSPSRLAWPSRLEVALRGGIAILGYHAGYECADCGVTDLSGTGWWIDADVGWRFRSWTFSAFFSYMWHRDYIAPNGVQYWDLRLHVFEPGLRATWHHGPLSLGVGVMPLLTTRVFGPAAVHVDLCPHPAALQLDEGDGEAGAELHAELDVARVGRLRVQLFGLAEGTTGIGTSWSLTDARLGLGVVF